jgi:hypothetical protein
VRDGDRLPAGSHQRSSFEFPEPGPSGPVRTPAPSQALIDQLAEADLAHRLAETRKVDAEVRLVEDDRRHRRAETREVEVRAAEGEARTSLIQRQEEKVAGEIAQQPLEAQEREARTARDEAATLRDLALTLSPFLVLAIGFITGSIDAGHLAGHGSDLIGDKLWLLPNLTGR